MALGRRSTPKKKAATAKKSKQAKAPGQPDPGTLPFKFVSLQSPPDDTYADGMSGIAVGRDVVKLEFYRSVGFDAEEKKEVRILSHRLVLPRSAIPELMQMLQGYSQAVQQAAQKMADRSEAETKT